MAVVHIISIICRMVYFCAFIVSAPFTYTTYVPNFCSSKITNRYVRFMFFIIYVINEIFIIIFCCSAYAARAAHCIQYNLVF